MLKKKCRSNGRLAQQQINTVTTTSNVFDFQMCTQGTILRLLLLFTRIMEHALAFKIKSISITLS